jgi:single-stranded-DNA-specific exonuclease
MNKLFAQIAKQRHLTEDFLHPKYENLTDPYTIFGMKEATNRIKKAVSNQEKVLIYGDYDVDGVTASVIMENALRLAGIKDPKIMLPDRFIDGYGMSPRLITRAKDEKITLVITVDCGSRNHEIIQELNELGIDTIVTDHHECTDDLPEALAIINPHRKDHPAENLQNLSGAGVAFKVAEGLAKEQLILNGQEKWLLDLVLLGTICDQMTLIGENRILGFYGIKVLGKTRRPGLRELMKNAGVKSITSESIGFQIGPRLNAAGRLETAELSLNLLRTQSPTEATALAMKLEELNKKRRTEQRAATDEIIKNGQPKDASVIIETGKWHEGILGIVAGRLVEKYHKPAFVLTEIENGIYKGSGRSFGDFNLADALNYAKDTIISGGGHAAAAGVRVYQKDLYAFREKMNFYYDSLHLKNQEQYFKSHADFTIDSLQDFTLDFLDDLKLLEPYGAGNEEPIFHLTNATILEKRRMGEQHLRLDLQTNDEKTIKAVAFFAPEAWFNLDSYDSYDFLIKPVENEWRGTRSIEARLIDVYPKSNQ